MSGADFTPHTAEEIRLMLAAIGVSSVEELFAPIPPELRAASFDLSDGISEFEMLSTLRKLAAISGQPTTFVGGGFFDHLIPSAVNHLAGRAEFYTAYTPYQPECSQGTLQALFEYQSAICALTGMEVANASLYDGATALAEAALMALRITGRNRIVVDSAISPFSRQVLKTYLAELPVELVEITTLGDLSLLSAAITEETAAVLVQNPNFFGTLLDLRPLAEALHRVEALLVASVYPLSLGIVATPAEIGVDIVIGDGQSLGNPLSFGGPSFGFVACRRPHIRNLPGRIVGETVDTSGKRGYVLTLQAREQHIRRHRATSNICSNQSLCALRGLIFLSLMGREGFADLARLNYDKAEYAKSTLSAIRGVTLLNSAPTFNEFTLVLPQDAAPLVAALLKKGVAAGLPLGGWYPEMGNCLVVTVTEKRSRQEIDQLAALLAEQLASLRSN
jgi:glycine dehydrogenase subunit 1